MESTASLPSRHSSSRAGELKEFDKQLPYQMAIFAKRKLLASYTDPDINKNAWN